MAYYREHVYLFFFGICRLLQRRNVLAQLLPRLAPHENLNPLPKASPLPPSSSSSSSSSAPSSSRSSLSSLSSPSSYSSLSSSVASRDEGRRSRKKIQPSLSSSEPAPLSSSVPRPREESEPCLSAPLSAFAPSPLVPYELNWVAAVRLSRLARSLIRQGRRELRQREKPRGGSVFSSRTVCSPFKLESAEVIEQASQALRLIRACQLVRPSWLCRTFAEYPLQKQLASFTAELAASLAASSTSSSPLTSSAAPVARDTSPADSRLATRRDALHAAPASLVSGGGDTVPEGNSNGEETEPEPRDTRLIQEFQRYTGNLRPFGEAPADKAILLKAEAFRRNVARRLYRTDALRVSLSALAPASRAALEAIYTTKQNSLLLRPGNFEKVAQLLPSWELRQAWTAFCFPSSLELASEEPEAPAASASFSAAKCTPFGRSQHAKREAARERLAKDLLEILQLQQAQALREGFPSWGHKQLEASLAFCARAGEIVEAQETIKTPETAETPETVETAKANGGERRGADGCRTDLGTEARRAATERAADAAQEGGATRGREGPSGTRDEGKRAEERIQRIHRLFRLIQREMKKGARGVDELGEAVERAVARERREREREANKRREASPGLTSVATAPLAKGEKKKKGKEKIDIADWLFAAAKVLKRSGADLRSSRFFSLNETLPKLVSLTEEVYGVRLVSLRGKAWKGFGRSFVGMPYLSDVFAVFDIDAASASASTSSTALDSLPSARLLDSLLVSAYGPQTSILSGLLPQASQSPVSLLAPVTPPSRSSFRGFLYFLPCEPLRLSHHFRAWSRDAPLLPSASLVAPGHAFAFGRLAPGPAGPEADRPMTLQEMDILLQVLTMGIKALLSAPGTAPPFASCGTEGKTPHRSSASEAPPSSPPFAQARSDASGVAAPAIRSRSLEQGEGRNELPQRSPVAKQQRESLGAVEALLRRSKEVSPCALTGDIVALTGQLDVPLPLDVQQSFCFLSGLLLQEASRLKALAFDPTAKGQAKRMSDDEARGQKPTIVDFLSLNGFFVHAFLDFHLHVTFNPRGATPKSLETFIRDKLESVLPYKLPESFDIFSLPGLQNYNAILSGTGVSYLLGQIGATLLLKELRSRERRKDKSSPASPARPVSGKQSSSASGSRRKEDGETSKRDKKKETEIRDFREIKSLFWYPERACTATSPRAESHEDKGKAWGIETDEKLLKEGIKEIIQDVYGASEGGTK
ncbi:conserved hypothetical protein [Neospora caninum Liverpool]|uniref:Uncharacterized protein n=1 Tax=Neospora caninum (strain Liverpool) TaxID=572307 RepID=F0VEQ4_NEOCL|nr:conserved hypothetical protein [Neospora caninum Liverpool]CBZ52198.1 conserved hypothetical protein [Neospora caninum Liverpool]CEL66165.1 TPA: hypothetical protein BN1204_019870 [Neospora caninum Liverpool]|eukprot:XP_003882230.1 conserved hypothetical protein [Neospora caninum Liverpool]